MKEEKKRDREDGRHRKKETVRNKDKNINLYLEFHMQGAAPVGSSCLRPSGGLWFRVFNC